MWLPLIKKSIPEDIFEIFKLATKHLSIYHRLNYLNSTLKDREIPVQISLMDVIRYLFQQFTYQFNFAFIPFDSFHHTCSLCVRYFSKHLLFKPCCHFICQDCTDTHDIAQLCPVCFQPYNDVCIDFAICKQQLSCKVKCPHSENEITESYNYIQKQMILYDNLDTFSKSFNGLTSHTLDMIERFNSHDIPQSILNNLRVDYLGFLRKRLSIQVFANPQSLDLIVNANASIQLYQITQNQKKTIIMPCEFSGSFEQLSVHIKQQCLHHNIGCKNPQCRVATHRQTILLHQESCPYQTHCCPICYKNGIPAVEFTQHQIDCLNRVSALEQMHKQDFVPDDVENEVDSDFEYHIWILDKLVDKLTDKILKMSQKQQKDVMDYQRVMGNQKQKSVVPQKIKNVMQYLFNDRQLEFGGLNIAVSLLIFDLFSQMYPKYIQTISWFFVAYFTILIILYSMYMFQFINSKLYKLSMFKYALTSHVAMAGYFGLLYTFFATISGYFSGFHFERLHTNIFRLYLDAFYFSMITSCLVGFGDITALHMYSRVSIFAEIIFGLFMLYFIFRGASFYIRALILRDKSRSLQNQMRIASEFISGVVPKSRKRRSGDLV